MNFRLAYFSLRTVSILKGLLFFLYAFHLISELLSFLSARDPLIFASRCSGVPIVKISKDEGLHNEMKSVQNGLFAFYFKNVTTRDEIIDKTTFDRDVETPAFIAAVTRSR